MRTVLLVVNLRGDKREVLNLIKTNVLQLRLDLFRVLTCRRLHLDPIPLLHARVAISTAALRVHLGRVRPNKLMAGVGRAP